MQQSSVWNGGRLERHRAGEVLGVVRYEFLEAAVHQLSEGLQQLRALLYAPIVRLLGVLIRCDAGDAGGSDVPRWLHAVRVVKHADGLRLGAHRAQIRADQVRHNAKLLVTAAEMQNPNEILDGFGPLLPHAPGVLRYLLGRTVAVISSLINGQIYNT